MQSKKLLVEFLVRIVRITSLMVNAFFELFARHGGIREMIEELLPHPLFQ